MSDQVQVTQAMDPPQASPQVVAPDAPVAAPAPVDEPQGATVTALPTAASATVEQPTEGAAGDAEEEEHGEIYEDLLELKLESGKRQRAYGGMPLEEDDDKEAMRKLADRFLEKFTKVGAATAVRDELRDNVYPHLIKTVEIAVDIAANAEDIWDELEVLKELAVYHRKEIDRMHAAQTDVVMKQLVCLARVLASRVLEKYGSDPEVALVARTIVETYAVTPSVAATDAAAQAEAVASVGVSP